VPSLSTAKGRKQAHRTFVAPKTREPIIQKLVAADRVHRLNQMLFSFPIAVSVEGEIRMEHAANVTDRPQAQPRRTSRPARSLNDQEPSHFFTRMSSARFGAGDSSAAIGPLDLSCPLHCGPCGPTKPSHYSHGTSSPTSANEGALPALNQWHPPRSRNPAVIDRPIA